MKRLFILITLFGFVAIGCTDKDTDNNQDNNQTEEPSQGGENTPDQEEPVFDYEGLDSYTIAREGEVVFIDITTNIEYTVEIPDNAKHWIAFAYESRTELKERLKFTIIKNPRQEERSATVLLKNLDQEVLQSITFNQERGENPNAIKFADKTVETLCLDNWDHNDDGDLTYEEAAAVTDIATVFAHSAIESFTELEYFTGITALVDYAFEGCDKLTDVTIPDQILSIGLGAFKYCSLLKEVQISDSVTTIGDNAFEECGSIESMSIGKGVTSFGRNSFKGCTGTLSINSNIPDAGEYYAYGIFYGSRFSTVTIGSNVTTIGSSAFEGSQITSVEIADNVGTIGKYAFRDCAALKTVKFPANLSSIGISCFERCESLQEASLPSNVKALPTNIFKGCASLASVSFSNEVTSIGAGAFDGCKALTAINIPSGVSTIEDYALRDCSSLSQVTIEKGVKKLGALSFSGCTSLTTITLPTSVTSIGEKCFLNCKNLKTVYCKPTTPPTLSTQVFQYFDSSSLANKNIACTIYVPTSSVSTYKSKSNWSNYKSLIVGYNF